MDRHPLSRQGSTGLIEPNGPRAQNIVQQLYSSDKVLSGYKPVFTGSYKQLGIPKVSNLIKERNCSDTPKPNDNWYSPSISYKTEWPTPTWGLKIIWPTLYETWHFWLHYPAKWHFVHEIIYVLNLFSNNITKSSKNNIVLLYFATLSHVIRL